MIMSVFANGFLKFFVLFGFVSFIWISAGYAQSVDAHLLLVNECLVHYITHSRQLSS